MESATTILKPNFQEIKADQINPYPPVSHECEALGSQADLQLFQGIVLPD